MNEFEQRANRAVEHYRAIHLTNADRIRGMTDEELADLLEKTNAICGDWCDERYSPEECIGESAVPRNVCLACVLDWLKSTVEEGDK